MSSTGMIKKSEGPKAKMKPHYFFQLAHRAIAVFDNASRAISASQLKEIIEEKDRQISSLQDLVASKEKYIEQFEKKLCNSVLNLKKTIEQRDKTINNLEDICHGMVCPMKEILRQYNRHFDDHDIPSI